MGVDVGVVVVVEVVVVTLVAVAVVVVDVVTARCSMGPARTTAAQARTEMIELFMLDEYESLLANEMRKR